MNSQNTNLCFGYSCVVTIELTHSLPDATTHAGSWPTQKPPPIISISGPGPPVPDSQLLCILPHSINPSRVWPTCSSSALRLVQGNFLAWKIILHSHYMSCPFSLVILIVVTRSASSYKQYSSSLYLDLHTTSSHMSP